MGLLLVIHDMPADNSPASKAFFEAIFEVAPEHWPLAAGAALVAAEVSPTYLRDHLVRELRRTGHAPGLLLVGSAPKDLAWRGLPAEGEDWLKGVLAE